MPGIINGALIAFTMSIDDFVISYFTAGSQVSTLSMVVYSMVRRRVSPEINALSTLMFVAVLAAADRHQPAAGPAGCAAPGAAGLRALTPPIWSHGLRAW